MLKFLKSLGGEACVFTKDGYCLRISREQWTGEGDEQLNHYFSLVVSDRNLQKSTLLITDIESIALTGSVVKISDLLGNPEFKDVIMSRLDQLQAS